MFGVDNKNYPLVFESAHIHNLLFTTTHVLADFCVETLSLSLVFWGGLAKFSSDISQTALAHTPTTHICQTDGRSR